MKNIKRLVAILRAAGVTLLILALAITIYIFATSGSLWKEMKTALSDVGANTGIITRLTYNSNVFAALSDSSHNEDEGPNARANAIAAHMESYIEDGREAEAAKQQKAVEDVYTYFETEFDAAAFMESYSQREQGEDEKELVAVFEQLDAMTTPVTKTGKKLPAAASSGNSRADAEAKYAELVEEHGEEVGSMLDFARTLTAMIQAEKDAGTAVNSVADYLKNSFDYDAYLAALPEAQSMVSEGSSANFLDVFAAEVEKQVNGEAVDYEAFFMAAYEDMQNRYPNENLATYEVFVPTVRGLIDSGVAFDGSYGALRNSLLEATKTAKSSSFDAVMQNHYDSIIEEAADNEDVDFMADLWKACAAYGWIWLAGVAMLIVASIVDYILSHALINRRERKHIEEESDVLLRVNHLKQYFRSGDFVNKAVDDVSFYVKKGEVFGLVGESGCGKTTTGRTIINLYDPTDGDVYFQGLRISSNQNGLGVMIRQLKKDYEQKVNELSKKYSGAELAAKKKELKKKLSDDIEFAQISALESSVEKSRSTKLYREKRKAELTAEYAEEIKNLSCEAAEERTKRFKQDLKVASKDNIMTKMQMIFQDPIASINPRMTVREIIAEGLIIRGVKDKKYIDEKVNEMLELVGLVREHADRYPHEFSGGQRQRIGIARAIVLEPDLIIADEPISALDVSIQAQVINLLNELRNKMGLTIMFIAHNLSVVKYFSDRIAVMYFGKIVEMTTSDELFAHPLHPYTKSLLSAIPYPDPHYEKQRKRIEYNPTLTHDYSVDKPSMREITPGHFIYCNDAEEAKYKKELGI